MKNMQRGFEILTKEERDVSIKNIIAFYLDERDEEMDLIGANTILDMFLEEVAPFVYNKAIEDTRFLAKKYSDGFDFDLAVLKKVK